MKNIISLVITVAVLLVMVVTCPKEEAHYDAVTTSLSDKAPKKAKPVAKFLLKMGVDDFVNVKNYVLFSVGTYNLNDNSGIVSLGIFGHVFTFMSEGFWSELGRSVGLR